MPINASYEYFNAEKAYLEAKTLDKKIVCLEEMIRAAPKHKGSENFLAELKTRWKKFLEKKDKAKKTGKSSIKGIKKEGYQIVLLGFSNSGKSALLASLTNAKPIISEVKFSIKSPEIGTLHHNGYHIQIIEIPAPDSDFFDSGLINTADRILFVVKGLEDYEKLIPYVYKSRGDRMLVVTKSDLMDYQSKRKIQETMRSRKINGILVSSKSGENLSALKDKITENTNYIRIFTKEPGKQKSDNPIVLPSGSNIFDVAESIRKGFSVGVKEIRITGPSSKFPNQKAGMKHKLKDFDIVEFHTR